MPRLAIDKDFLGDFSKLEKSVQNAVMAAFDKFEEHTYAGLHLEKLQKAKDDHIRTIRIDQFWRGVVLAPDSGDTYYLLKLLPHDEAIDYATSHKFTVNQALGVVDVRNQSAIERIQPSLEKVAEATDNRLFGSISDTDLTRFGIDHDVLVIARLLTSEAHLDAMQKMIPEVQYNALYLLAGGLSVEEVWAEVAQYAPQEPVDTGNIVKAMERTPGRVVFVSGNKELERILEHPFAAWRIFLHPAQRKIAYAPQYAGPVQVTGGAGTRKTVTALHRAAFLASRVSEELSAEEPRRSVLLTTFTRNLAEALEAQFDLLVDSGDVRNQVEILNVDRLAFQIAQAGPRRQAGGHLRQGADRPVGREGGRGGAGVRVDVPSAGVGVGAGDSRPGSANRAGLPDLLACRAGHAARQGAAPQGLEAVGIAAVSLAAKSAKKAVRVGTMHRMKGLEFQG